MRQVVLDTETTGLSPDAGDRVISIGCVEIIDRRITGNEWHTHLNPDGRASHPAALKVHGLTDEFLADKPRFEAVRHDVWRFIKRSELIIHNAPFDLGFLNMEIRRAGGIVALDTLLPVIDTLKLPAADGLRVGGSLNALADRYGIDRSARAQHHGALVDARLLAQALDLRRVEQQATSSSRPEGLVIPVPRCTAEELAAHQAMMESIKQRREASGP
jgi:DNA polymerase-3 subunit epsilon